MNIGFLKKRIIFLVICFALLGLAGLGLFYRADLMNWLISYYTHGLPSSVSQSDGSTGPSETNLPSQSQCLSPDTCQALPKAEYQELPEVKSILLEAPFVCQAPFGQWDDPTYQDGCEEVSALMAAAWARNEQSISPEKATEEIQQMAVWQKEKYGYSQDTSAQDTAERLINGYFNYSQATAKKNISLDDLISEIQQGHLVIVPADGRALGNPYFTQPGPERHMVVIRGYDEIKKEFITNDGGTKRGEKYRYDQNVLFNSIRDYPSGLHLPIEKIQKVMIVLWK